MRFALALLLVLGCARHEPAAPPIEVASPAFNNGQTIPAKYTCAGANISPPLQWSGVPPSAKSLTLTVDDPDASGGHFTHWQVTQIPPTTTAIPEGGHVGSEATNGFGKPGWGGPCPPSGEHHYVFTLTALDANGRAVGRGSLVGRFSK